MTWWADLTATLGRLFDEYGQLTAFILLLLEESGIPPLIPGDLLMVLMGVRAANGQAALLEVVLLLQLATVVGGSILYWVSAWGGQSLVYRLGRYIGATPERLDEAAASLVRHGEWAVILGRLAPGLSTLTTVTCGILGFPYRRFLPALAIGGFLRLLVFLLLGYFFGPSVLAIFALLHLPFEMVVSSLLLIGLAFWLYRAARAEKAEPVGRPRLAERLHSGVLAGMLGAIESTLLVNVLIQLFGLLAYDAPGVTLARSGLLAQPSAPTLALLIAPGFLFLPILWGAVYGVWAADALPGRSWACGAIFSLAPLAFSLLVVLPIVGAGPFGLNLGAGPLPALGEAVRHLSYGLVLGITFAALARRQPRGPLARTPHPA